MATESVRLGIRPDRRQSMTGKRRIAQSLSPLCLGLDAA
jgi:hypothetical protein